MTRRAAAPATCSAGLGLGGKDRPPAARALDRRAPAGRDRARAGHRTVAPARRRAHRRARPRAEPRRDAEARDRLARARPHAGDGHPRSGAPRPLRPHARGRGPRARADQDGRTDSASRSYYRRAMLRNALFLALRYLRSAPGRTAVLIAGAAVAFFLPLFTWRAAALLEHTLLLRAERSPILIGAKGNEFDLTLSLALLPRPGPRADRRARARPGAPAPATECACRSTSRTRAARAPIVGTGLEYFEARGLDARAPVDYRRCSARWWPAPRSRARCGSRSAARCARTCGTSTTSPAATR